MFRSALNFKPWFLSKKTHTMSRHYSPFNYPSEQEGNTLLTGVRLFNKKHKEYLITGFFEPKPEGQTKSFVYLGPLSSTGAKDPANFYELDFPSSSGKTVVSTNLYSPNPGNSKNTIDVVGNYTTAEQPGVTFGCLYQGKLDGTGIWRTLEPTGATQVIAHSTHMGLVVGNYFAGQPKAFLYDIYTNEYFDISIPNLISITAYGIWKNGNTNIYTICGGFLSSNFPSQEKAYLYDWNQDQKSFSNFRVYSYGNESAAITHFDGITTDGYGGYNLVGDYVKLTGGLENAFFCHIPCGSGKARWETIQVPPNQLTSGNTVQDSTAIGVYHSSNSGLIHGYLAKKVSKC